MSSIAFNRVLIADDAEWDRELLLNRLEAIGLKNVESATDGKDAMAKLGKGGYDLVITDMMMPRPKDGMELIKGMKADAALKSVPVIVASSANAMPSVIEAADAGANGFISKPYVEDELRAVLMMLSNSKRLFGK